MPRNFTTIVQSFKDFIRGTNSKIELSEGTFTSDVVIEAPAKEFENLYVRLDQVSLEQSINTASDVGLDQIANNFSKVRKSARRSRGVITFFKNVAPIVDIIIPAGTLVSTVLSDTTAASVFSTTQTITMQAALALSYLNTNTNKYEIQVEIEATNGGDVGNVGGGTIVAVTAAIAGIDGCYNPFATSGGVNSETSADFQARLGQALAGIAVGSLGGFTSFVLDQDSVQDVLVVGNGQTGRSDIGAVDIYVKGKLFTSFTDELSSPTGPYPNFVLSKQPVISTNQVTVNSSISGPLLTTAWKITKDTGAYGGSIVAQDTLTWVTPISTSSGSILVTYQYNSLIPTLQSLLSSDNENVLNSDTLIKWANEIDIDVTIAIRLLPGFTASDVSSSVQTFVASFLNSLGIGEQVQQSDLISAVLQVSGIDDIQIPLSVFKSSDGSIVVDTFGNLNIPVTSYAAPGTITVTFF